MKKSSLFNFSIILMVFYTGLIGQTTAQGIRNEDATINVASGCYVICQGGINNSGTITNNGTLTITGGIANSASNTIEGDGDYFIGGNWTNDGTFNPGTSSVTFNGTSAQTVAGSSITTFYDLIIDASSAGTIIPAGVRITVSGNVFSPNGKLTINSASVDNSGSLIYSGSNAPSGNVTYNRYLRPANNFGERHFFSSPVQGQAIDGFISANSAKISLVSSVYQIWEWDEITGTWPFTTSGSFVSGRGYNIEQVREPVSDGLLTFTGTLAMSPSLTGTAPYDNTVPRYTAQRNPWGGGGWNLLGNPYTSSLRITDDSGDDENDENDFLAKNLSSFDPSYRAVYIYNGTIGLHGTYRYIAKPVPFTDPFTGDDPAFTDFGSKYVQAGQGFFVLANYNAVPFTFTREMQAHNTGITMTKSAEAEASWPGLHLKVKYGGNETYTTVIYNEKMSAGLDPGYDVGLFGTGEDVKVYSSLVEKDNSVNFARQALPLIDCEKNIIPVGIDTEKGGYVTFSAYTVPIGDNKFWLEDRTAGIFTNLNANTYTVTLPANTYGTGRFFIIASTNTPTGNNDITEEAGSELRIWTHHGKVIIKGAVSEGTLCEIYDTGGRKVVMTHLTDGELNTVTLPSGSGGVYLVRVIDGVKVVTGKVALL